MRLRCLFDKRRQYTLKVYYAVPEIAPGKNHRHIRVGLCTQRIVHHGKILEVCRDGVRRKIFQILHRVAAGDRTVSEIVKRLDIVRCHRFYYRRYLAAAEVTVVFVCEGKPCSVKHFCKLAQVCLDEPALFRERVLLVVAARRDI